MFEIILNVILWVFGIGTVVVLSIVPPMLFMDKLARSNHGQFNLPQPETDTVKTETIR